MAAEIRFLPLAWEDLGQITDWLIDAADPDTADRYADRIEARCLELADFPAHGTPRDYLHPGLRSIPFERSATICYRVTHGAVEIVRVIRRGRDLGRAFAG